MVNLCFVYTKYQYDVFQSVKKSHNVDGDVYFIAPDKLRRIFINDSESAFFFLSEDRGVSFRQARELINEIKFLSRNFRSEPVMLWLASDDHPVGQVLLRNLDIDAVMLLEDGIGSYIKHKPFSLDRGLRGFLGRIKNFIFYFPHYRALYGCGGNVRAERCFAYSEYAFPLQRNRPQVIVYSFSATSDQVRYWLPSGSIIVIGQPLAMDCGLPISTYFSILQTAVCKISGGPPPNVYYKPHPREDCRALLPLLQEARWEIFDVNLPAEDLLFFCNNKQLKIVSFVSTALINLKGQLGLDCLYFISSRSLKLPSGYRSSLRRVGVMECECD